MGYRQASSPRKILGGKMCDFLKSGGGHQFLKGGGELPRILIGCNASITSDFWLTRHNFKDIMLKFCSYCQLSSPNKSPNLKILA